ncbi:MAG: hypothetical protein AUF68_01895 [Verrucomicrobia bacterium 13_1_20CM_54_28]|nr:MAG: hypothetical protein AUF68_01895 [Verrucomicrobia bacterium 13_1_20CM_54_28]PYK15139.1 MAG: hypothetical protein DME64_07975 [Verrucomicrobiota bacterium]
MRAFEYKLARRRRKTSKRAKPIQQLFKCLFRQRGRGVNLIHEALPYGELWYPKEALGTNPHWALRVGRLTRTLGNPVLRKA